MGLRAYLVFDVTIRTNKLAVAPYSPYQKKLHRMILRMRNDGMSYNAIADWLNKNGFKTPRGKLFRNAHAHSIIKKKAIRDNRMKKSKTVKVDGFDVIYV